MDKAAESKTAGTCHHQQQQQQINLEEIKNISEDEFKQQLLNWIETNCVAKTMQSKLRKDLIDNFNRTSLGTKYNKNENLFSLIQLLSQVDKLSFNINNLIELCCHH